MTDPARSSVFRLCQEGYASVLPVRAVLVGEGPAVLKDSKKRPAIFSSV